jgi:D-alanyl-D-alanine carboxypeptidase
LRRHWNISAPLLRRSAIPIVAVLLTLLSACDSSSDSSSTDASSDEDSETTTACVTDVEKVIATEPTPESTTASLPADLVSELDAAAQSSFEEAAAPGAIVGVRTPQGTWIEAYGEADPSAGTPMTPDMHTRIGSVTKTFTGTVIMQLAEQGRLSLDDTIDMYVPDIPNGNRITLQMLADMTSGIASYTQSTQFTDTYFSAPETIFTPDELIAVGVRESPIFEPGEEFNYSNTNTVLLGKVIEQVTGQPVADVFRQLIFEPLELANTSWPGESTEIPTPYPQGFTLQGDTATPENPSNATNWNPAWGWTAGELISNMDDLLVYDRALGTGQGLLEPATQAERFESIPGPAGYGIAMGCVDGWVGHTGELPGYNTSVFYDTQNDTSVVVQTNSDIASGDCEESPTLTDDPRTAVCSSPATRMFVALSEALGHTFTPIPAR